MIILPQHIIDRVHQDEARRLWDEYTEAHCCCPACGLGPLPVQTAGWGDFGSGGRLVPHDRGSPNMASCRCGWTGKENEMVAMNDAARARIEQQSK